MMTGRILVIEDDRNISEMLTDMLQSAGYEAIGLRHPDLVMEVVGHERPDLILLDVMLPRKSGIEVADQLWVNGFGAIPIIAMSASPIMIDLAGQTPFFESVLQKPFEMDAFLGEIHDVLREHIPSFESEAAGYPM